MRVIVRLDLCPGKTLTREAVVDAADTEVDALVDNLVLLLNYWLRGNLFGLRSGDLFLGHLVGDSGLLPAPGVHLV